MNQNCVLDNKSLQAIDTTQYLVKSGDSMNGTLMLNHGRSLQWTTNNNDNNTTGCSWYGMGRYTNSDGYNWLNLSNYWGINITTREGNYLQHNGNTILTTVNTGDYLKYYGTVEIMSTNYNVTTVNPGYVKINGTIVDQTAGRGHHLTVLRKSDLSLVTSYQYDTYGNSGLCDSLVSQMQAYDSNYILILTTFDAITCNANLSNTLIAMGAQTGWTCGSDRYSHLFIGSTGLRSGLGFIAGSSSQISYSFKLYKTDSSLVIL